MPLDTTVQCQQCQREERVVLSVCLQTGWPQCCGQTMLLTQTPGKEAIDAAVRSMVEPVRAVRNLCQ